MSRIRWSKKRLILGILVLIIIIFMWSSDLHKKLTFEQIKTNALWLRDQVEHYYWWTVSIYLATFIAIIMCSLPGAALMTLVGGFLYGVIQGVFYVVIAATIGGTLFFFMVRYIIGNYIQSRFHGYLHNFNHMWQQRGWLFLLMMRCIPLIPFFLVNILAGLTNIKPHTFIWTTALGVIPTALIFTYAGRQFGSIEQMQDVFTLPILSALILLLLFALLPVLITRYRKIF